LSVWRVLSGVIVRFCAFGADKFVGGGGGDIGGVDHENVAAGDALFDRTRFVEGRDGKIVDDAADAEAFVQGSPPSMSVPVVDPCCPPRTSASKSLPPFSALVSKPLVAAGPPKAMKSFRVAALPLLAPSSWSFRVCSFSMRCDMNLMSVMYA